MTVQSQRRKFPDLVEMRQAITPLLIFYSTKGQVIYIKIPRVLAYVYNLDVPNVSYVFYMINGFNVLGTNISSTMPASSLHPVLQFRGLNFEEELDEYQETSTNRGNMFNSKSMFNESPIVDNLILQRSRNNSNDRYNAKSFKVINDDEVIIRSQFSFD